MVILEEVGWTGVGKNRLKDEPTAKAWSSGNLGKPRPGEAHRRSQVSEAPQQNIMEVF